MPFPHLRWSVPLGVLLLAPNSARAQHPDSIPELLPISVRVTRVTRVPELLSSLGSSVTVVDSTAIRRGRLGAGLDEALAFVPGVIAANRWNPSLDQRLIIRGFGARANFGVRGIKILLDGVPQTMPDGQSQLTNLDLAQIGRIEVLRGAASSAYGNAAGGVVAFTSADVPTGASLVDAGMERGSYGLNRVQSGASARIGRVWMTSSHARTLSSGFRAQSTSEQQRYNIAFGWAASPATQLTLRGAWGNDPRADNPGALTLAEATATPQAGAPNNLRRNAGKALTQGQLAFGVDHAAGPWSAELRTWVMRRSIENPLAAPAPAPTSASEGLWIGLERRGEGLRTSATRTLQHGSRITAGLDWQSSRDDRINRRHTTGTPSGTALLDQRESVREVGLFTQVAIPIGAWQLRTGVRWDGARFNVTDHLGNGSGARSMEALSGHASLARQFGRTTAWTSVATSFETPTTSELANQPDGTTGLNRELRPQQSVTLEAGVRTNVGWGHGEFAAWTTATRDAITPFQEIGGRSYFTNAAKTRTRGVEATVTVPLSRHVTSLGTLTVTDATFREYLLGTNRLDGNRVAGIPRTVGRVGLRGEMGALAFDVDHAFSTLQYGDDGNSLAVAGWGTGITGARIRWRVPGRRMFTPFFAVQNIFARQVIGSVTVNGGFGRVAEPSAGRVISVGGTIRLYQVEHTAAETPGGSTGSE